MKKYDSIPRYGKQGTRDILGTEVVVMEKLDGANASFGIIGGELKMFSRNQELNEMTEMLKKVTMVNGVVDGNWTFKKQGANFGISYVGEESE